MPGRAAAHGVPMSAQTLDLVSEALQSTYLAFAPLMEPQPEELRAEVARLGILQPQVADLERQLAERDGRLEAVFASRSRRLTASRVPHGGY